MAVRELSQRKNNEEGLNTFNDEQTLLCYKKIMLIAIALELTLYEFKIKDTLILRKRVHQ